MSGTEYRKPNRYKYYNYSQSGLYFVTICVFDKEPVFGDIIDERVILSQFGVIAENCWKDVPVHFPDSQIDEFIIMPNHVHGIIIINNFDNSVGHRHACALQNCDRKHERLPVIIGAYKSSVSKHIHESGYNEFKWQRSYYDRIIRNENELNEIRRYIKYNHLKTP